MDANTKLFATADFVNHVERMQFDKVWLNAEDEEGNLAHYFVIEDFGNKISIAMQPFEENPSFIILPREMVEEMRRLYETTNKFDDERTIGVPPEDVGKKESLTKKYIGR
jgi:hypothetical protein